jgi:WD40 repeat protein
MNRYVALILVFMLLFSTSGCGGGASKPNPGVYLNSNSGLIKLERVRGNPQQQGIPQASDTHPVITFYLPLDDVKQVQLRSLSGRINFDTVSATDGVYAIKPIDSLGVGVYCLSLGGPLVSPSDVSYWCFQVGSVVGLNPTANTITIAPPTEPPTPAPTDTPIPIVRDVISPSNADQVAQVAASDYLGNTSWPNAISYSPDGHLLAVAANLVGTYLLDARTLAQVKSFKPFDPGSPSRDVVFSPDGQTLAVATDRRERQSFVVLYSVDSGQVLRSLAHPKGLGGIAFSPDGDKLVSTIWGSQLFLWRVSDGTLLNSLTEEGETYGSMALSPDGKTLAVEGFVKRLYQLADDSFQEILHFEGGGSLTFSPDGKVLASGVGDGEIYLSRVSDGSIITKLNGQQNGINDLAFSPDGKIIVSASQDATIMIWRVKDGKMLKSLSANPGGVRSIAYSPDGQTFASGGNDARVLLWGIP